MATHLIDKDHGIVYPSWNQSLSPINKECSEMQLRYQLPENEDDRWHYHMVKKNIQ